MQDLRVAHYTASMPNQISQQDFTYFKPPPNPEDDPTMPLDALYMQEMGEGGATIKYDPLAVPPAPNGYIQEIYIDPPPDPTTFLPDECHATNKHFFGEDPNTDDVSSCRYRVYYPRSTTEGFPTGRNYDLVPLPCVVLFHPGGFQECEDNLQPGIKTMCLQFALRGFIAITVDYRGGRLKDIDADRTSVQQQLAPYRAIQDARGAIRSIIKRNGESGINFRINEDQFFVGGMSAGSIASLGAAYYRNQAMINEVYFNAPSSTITMEAASRTYKFRLLLRRTRWRFG